MVSPANQREVIRARGRDYDPGTPGKIQSRGNFGIWDRVTAERTETYRERRDSSADTLIRNKKVWREN